MPSKEEFIEGAKQLNKFGGKLDYIITHEPPTQIKGIINPDLEPNAVNIYLEQ